MDAEVKTEQDKLSAERRARIEQWVATNLHSKREWFIQSVDGAFLFSSAHPIDDKGRTCVDVFFETGYDVDKDGHLGQHMFGDAL
jgi:hypothetical protein